MSNVLFLLIGLPSSSTFFFFNDTATTEIYTLSLHDALPIYKFVWRVRTKGYELLRASLRELFYEQTSKKLGQVRSEEHTSELHSHLNLVCRLLLEKKKKNIKLDTVQQRLGV